MRENDFEPKFGRILAMGTKPERRYLQEVVKGIARAGGKSAKGKGGFNGKHGGRGSDVGRVLAPRDRYAAFRTQRAIVKSRIVKLKDKVDAARAHLCYIRRGDVTRE